MYVVGFFGKPYGFRVLAQALEANSSLTQLMLSHNGLDSTAAQQLAKVNHLVLFGRLSVCVGFVCWFILFVYVLCRRCLATIR